MLNDRQTLIEREAREGGRQAKIECKREREKGGKKGDRREEMRQGEGRKIEHPRTVT